ncbi:hypothetical protein DV738_g2883, partial [Chaetothyriales sp. CBS 135597]
MIPVSAQVPSYPSSINSANSSPYQLPAQTQTPKQTLAAYETAHRPRLDGTSPSRGAPGSDYPDDPSLDGVPAFAGDHPHRIEMNQDEIDAIIRNKRKVRDPKACYACHRRKVKCNRELPCDSCVKRDHPELCSYERPTKKRRIALTTGLPREGSDDGVVGVTVIKQEHAFQATGPNITVPREQWERLNEELKQLPSAMAPPTEAVDVLLADTDHKDSHTPLDDTELEGIFAPSDQMGTIHLGPRSVLAYMKGLGRGRSTPEARHPLLEENVLPKLGLDNESVTYPFVDLWSTDTAIGDLNGLCSAIPDDVLCKDFYQFYRDVACAMYPVLPEPDRFEETLDLMLANRSKAVRESLDIDQAKPLGISLAFLALVFAVLASGAQCSRLRAKERELTSQVYTCCSYQALRMSNFLTHPCLETIQASLIISNVLSYNMNPGVAYIFLGMVTRMAFSIGLHMNPASFGEHEAWLRQHVWWALAWQDSHFSISYDRPTATVMCAPDIPYAPDSKPGQRTYAETMYSIIQLTQEVIRHRALHSSSALSWATIKRYRDRVVAIVADAAPHLRDASVCTSVTQHVERLGLKVHTTYIISEICRPALKEQQAAESHPANTTPLHSPTKLGSSNRANSALSPGPVDSTLPCQLRRECITNLEATVASYVELYSVSEFAARSWIVIQRTVSAAFLLGTLPQLDQESHVLQLLREFERCIARRIREDPAFEDLDQQQSGSPAVPGSASLNTPRATTHGPRWASSMVKSLNALGKLNATLNGQQLSTPKRRPNTNSNNKPANYPQLGHLQHHLRPHALPNPPTPTNTHMHFPLPPQLGAPSPAQDYSPNMGISRMGHVPCTLGPITPDSTGSSSGDWNYANLTERSSEYVQPPLWG